MTYRLGVDLGTTYSSAAVAFDGRARIVALGNRSALVPSFVFARPDGTLLTGEAADRRAMAEPGRAAREYKRRMGDPTAFDLGSVSLRADQLMASLLPAILDATTAKEGGPADALALTHPANWGRAKRNQLLEAVAALDVGVPPTILVSEPEAAAIYYAESEHIDVGEVVAVYDLGGGTFDAAVLRRTATGFDLMGPPEGIDRLGGVDFDAAVYAHVNRFLDGALDTFEPHDPTVAAGLSRLRADCVEAKEALSADTDVAIPVLLPGLRTELRMTRQELESMIRPALGDTLGALRRALRSAHVVPADVRVVLLVGGSSRIPLVAQMVGAEIGRPVAIDVHPKHAVALGAALAADARAAQGELTVSGDDTGGRAAAVGAPSAPPTAADVPPTGAAAAAAAPSTPAVGSSPAEADRSGSPPIDTAPTELAPAEPVATEPAAPAGPPPLAGSAAGGTGAAGGSPGGEPAAARRPVEPLAAAVDGADPATGGSRRTITLLGIVAAAVLAVIVGVVVLGGGGDGDGGGDGATGGSAAVSTTADPTGASGLTATTPGTAATTSSPTTTPTTPTTAPTTAPTVPTSTTLPADCVDHGEPFVCIFSVSKDADGNLIIPFQTYGFTAVRALRHIHFFFPDNPLIAADVTNAGSGGPSPADWRLWDLPNPFGLDGERDPYTVADAKAIGATRICVLVADSSHAVTPGTGNCLPIPPEVLA